MAEERAEADVSGAKPPLMHLGYVSTQTRPLASAEIVELLDSARSFNQGKDVTGVLLHRAGSFFQVLEGAHADVHDVYERVLADTRHGRIEMLFEEPIDEREFADWRMGFLELDGLDVSKLNGVSDFLTRDIDPREMFTELTRAKRLMMLFRQMS